MARTYRLQVVTQQGVKYDGQVHSLRAPGAEGSFGVRPGHAPLVAQLTIGLLLVREPDQPEKVYACSGGILEVTPEGVVILADAVERSSEIDVARAEQAQQRARERLRHRGDREIDPSRAEIALARAVNRLKTADHGR